MYASQTLTPVQPGKESDSLVGELWEKMEDEIVKLKEKPIKTTILGKDPKNKGHPTESFFVDIPLLSKAPGGESLVLLTSQHDI